MSESMDNIDRLFDDDNTENVILVDNDGGRAEFEPIALITLGSKRYAILAPLAPMLGVELESDEAVVFAIEETEGGASFSLVTDEQIVDEVFEIYDELWDAENEE